MLLLLSELRTLMRLEKTRAMNAADQMRGSFTLLQWPMQRAAHIVSTAPNSKKRLIIVVTFVTTNRIAFFPIM